MPPAKPACVPSVRLSFRTWFALVSLLASVLGSIWAFTLTVWADIRETKTLVKALRENTADISQRVERLEGVYIGRREKKDSPGG